MLLMFLSLEVFIIASVVNSVAGGIKDTLNIYVKSPYLYTYVYRYMCVVVKQFCKTLNPRGYCLWMCQCRPLLLDRQYPALVSQKDVG